MTENNPQQTPPENQPKQHVREQFLEIDFTQYEAEGGTQDSPIRFFRNKNNHADRLVRILAPGYEYPVPIRIPEVVKNERLKKMVKEWKDIEHKVMLDSTTLWLLAEIGSRYNRRQPLILEGPPAVSKTFTIWLFSCIIGQLYCRLNCSSGTKESHILGALTPETKRKVCPDLYQFIDSVAVSDVYDEIKKMDEEKRLPSERDIVLMVDYIRDLKKKGVSLEDDAVFFAAQVLQSSRDNLKLILETQFPWQDSDFVRVVESGGVATLDEPNTVEDTGVLECLLPMLEVGTPTITMPTARGKDLSKSSNAFIVAAQNPPSVAGRVPLSSAFESRCEKVVLPDINAQYVENVLNFFMTGNDPDVRVKGGKLVPGRRGVETPHKKFLEQMPKRDAVVKAIAGIHILINEAVNHKKIGASKKDGGSYVFDQRDISAMLDSMVASINRNMVVDTADGLQPVEIDWVFVVKKALSDVYLSCLPGDETRGDYKFVNDIIENSPLWNQLRSKKDASYVSVGPNAKVMNNGETIQLDLD